MNQQNPWMKAWANAERTYHKKELAKVLHKKKMIKGREFLDGTHLYERTFSDKYTGERKKMNGRDAKALNDDLFQDFLAAVTNNVEGRSLERWKVVERFVEKQKHEQKHEQTYYA